MTPTTPLAAAVTIGTTVSVVLGILVAAANVIAGLPFAGSLLFAASWAGIGLIVAVGGSSWTTAAVAPVAQAPAVWVIVSIACASYAWRRRWAPAEWGILVAVTAFGQIGELLSLPSWAVDLSPYTYAPTLPVQPFALRPELVLSSAALAIMAGAWLAYRGRDIG